MIANLKKKLKDLVTPSEHLIALDIGSGGIKFLAIDIQGERPILRALSFANFKEDIISNNQVIKKEIVSEAIKSLMEANEIQDERAVVCVPGPAALMKKIRISKMKLAAMKDQVRLEAGSFLPSGLQDALIDFHILGEGPDKTYDALVVAVKSEVVASFTDAILGGGVETAVVDVDYFAINNCFEVNYPEYLNEVVAVVDIGARFSNIILSKGGQVLYAGDLAFGAKAVTDEISTKFEVSHALADEYKRDPEKIEDRVKQEAIKDYLDKKVQSLAVDFNRQLTLFWNASGVDDSISRVMLTGGGALIGGFVVALQTKTGIVCEILDPFKELEIAPEVDEQYLETLSPLFTVAVGLGLRQAGDRVLPE